MATQYERAFVQHLTVSESLGKIVEIGLPVEALADDGLRQVYDFALAYWHDDHFGGQAPSGPALRTHFGNILAESEIDVDVDPEDSLSWAMDAIRGSYIDRRWQGWVRDFATDMSGADLLAKPEVLTEALSQLMQLQTALARKPEQIDVRSGMIDRLAEYVSRANDRQSSALSGMRFGLPMVDEHMSWLRPGELAVLAAGPKTGKSFFLLWAALAHWLSGGTPVVFTLENSVEMAQDRLACMALGIDARRWSRGECTDDEIRRVKEWIEQVLRQADRPFWILQPEPGKRTVELMVRQARVLGDGLYIDQLTFVDVSKASERSPRNIQVRDILHDLKALVSSGQRLPCLLAHQINREGVKAAEKSGRLEMYHLAESSEVERTADWVFGLWQGQALRSAGRAYLLSLAARREDLVDWEMVWRPHIGNVGVRAVVNIRDQS